MKAGEITTHTVKLPMGVLIVNTAPGAEVFVDGERIGSAPLAPIPAAVGAREVLVRHVDHGERRQSVDVTPGKPVELSVLFEGANTVSRPQPKLAPLEHAAGAPEQTSSTRADRHARLEMPHNDRGIL